MTPTSPNLEIRNMSRSYELPDGTGALVPTSRGEGQVQFIKTHCRWKRIRLANEGVELVIDHNQGAIEEPGYGNLLEVQQLPKRPEGVGDDLGAAAPPSLSPKVPVSSAKDGILKDSDLPAFRGDLERDFQLSIFPKVVCGPEAFMAHCVLINAYVEGKSIT